MTGVQTCALPICMKPKVGSMGVPNPLFDVDLVDPDGNPVKVGEPVYVEDEY